MEVVIKLKMPTETDHKDHKECIEDKAKSACTLIESGHESRKEWNWIRALNNELMKRKQNGRLGSRGEELLKIIAPTINRHGMVDPRGVELDPELQTEEHRHGK